LRAKARAIEPPFYNALVEKLQTTDARYPFIRSVIAGPYQLPKTNLSHSYRIFQDTAPLTVLMFFVRVDAFEGNYSTLL